MNIPPRTILSGDETKAQMLNGRALQFYNSVTSLADVRGQTFLKESMVLDDGSIITITSDKTSIYGHRTGTVEVYGRPSGVLPLQDVYVTYRSPNSPTSRFIYTSGLIPTLYNNIWNNQFRTTDLTYDLGAYFTNSNISHYKNYWYSKNKEGISWLDTTLFIGGKSGDCGVFVEAASIKGNKVYIVYSYTTPYYYIPSGKFRAEAGHPTSTYSAGLHFSNNTGYKIRICQIVSNKDGTLSFTPIFESVISEIPVPTSVTDIPKKRHDPNMQPGQPNVPPAYPFIENQDTTYMANITYSVPGQVWTESLVDITTCKIYGFGETYNSLFLSYRAIDTTYQIRHTELVEIKFLDNFATQEVTYYSIPDGIFKVFITDKGVSVVSAAPDLPGYYDTPTSYTFYFYTIKDQILEELPLTFISDDTRVPEVFTTPPPTHPCGNDINGFPLVSTGLSTLGYYSGNIYRIIYCDLFRDIIVYSIQNGNSISLGFTETFYLIHNNTTTILSTSTVENSLSLSAGEDCTSYFVDFTYGHGPVTTCPTVWNSGWYWEYHTSGGAFWHFTEDKGVYDANPQTQWQTNTRHLGERQASTPTLYAFDGKVLVINYTSPRKVYKEHSTTLGIDNPLQSKGSRKTFIINVHNPLNDYQVLEYRLDEDDPAASIGWHSQSANYRPVSIITATLQ